MKDYPPLPDGLPRVLSASSALTACPDSVCPVLDAPELEELNGSSDRWIAGRLRRLPLRNEDNEPRRIRDLSAGYAEQGFELRRLGARLLLADGVTSVAEARAAVLGGLLEILLFTGLPVMICVELDDEGETPEGVPFASILASVQHLGVAAVGFRCSGDRIDTLSILGQHAAFAAVPLMPVLRSRGRSPEEICSCWATALIMPSLPPPKKPWRTSVPPTGSSNRTGKHCSWPVRRRPSISSRTGSPSVSRSPVSTTWARIFWRRRPRAVMC